MEYHRLQMGVISDSNQMSADTVNPRVRTKSRHACLTKPVQYSVANKLFTKYLLLLYIEYPLLQMGVISDSNQMSADTVNPRVRTKSRHACLTKPVQYSVANKLFTKYLLLF